MRLTEITEPLGLQLLRNLFAKGVSIQLDILDTPNLLIRHFFAPDQPPANSFIQNVFISSISSPDKPGDVTIWADNGYSKMQDYVVTLNDDFDSLLTLVKKNNQWMLTNAPD